MLNQADFDSLVSDCGLMAEDCETMGSLGVPWSPSGFGWAPAISFHNEGQNSIVSCYVTPLPPEEDFEGTEEEWDEIRDEIVEKYKYGV